MDNVARSQIGGLAKEVARGSRDRMVALQNVEAMLLTRIRELTERVEKLEAGQWTAEEVVNESSDS